MIVRILSHGAPPFGIFYIRATSSAGMLPSMNFPTSIVTGIASMEGSRWGQSLLRGWTPSIVDEVVGRMSKNGEGGPLESAPDREMT